MLPACHFRPSSRLGLQPLCLLSAPRRECGLPALCLPAQMCRPLPRLRHVGLRRPLAEAATQGVCRPLAEAATHEFSSLPERWHQPHPTRDTRKQTATEAPRVRAHAPRTTANKTCLTKTPLHGLTASIYNGKLPPLGAIPAVDLICTTGGLCCWIIILGAPPVGYQPPAPSID